MRIDFGWLTRWLFESALRKYLEGIVRSQLPYTLNFKSGTFDVDIVIKNF